MVAITASIISEIIIVALALFVLFFVFSIGRSLVRLLMGLIVNAILGLASLFLLNTFLNVGIPLNTPEIIASVIFGLPAVGTMLILRIAGIPI